MTWSCHGRRRQLRSKSGFRYLLPQDSSHMASSDVVQSWPPDPRSRVHLLPQESSSISASARSPALQVHGKTAPLRLQSLVQTLEASHASTQLASRRPDGSHRTSKRRGDSSSTHHLSRRRRRQQASSSHPAAAAALCQVHCSTGCLPVLHVSLSAAEEGRPLCRTRQLQHR